MPLEIQEDPVTYIFHHKLFATDVTVFVVSTASCLIQQH